MSTRGRSGRDRRTNHVTEGELRLAPMARAIALTLAAGAVVAPAHAQRSFSPQWFGKLGATQDTVSNTGLMPNGKPASALLNPQAQQQKANEQLQRSINNLNLAARGIAAQQAAQAAAREAALNAGSSVPDGLAESGLKVDTNSLTAGWINANGPVQTATSGKTDVNVEQTAEKAILNWETFNVGKNTTVNFNQKGGNKADGTNSWIALNRINDPSGRPSQIAGQIKADGSVYIINRNGIIFNGGSQINTRSLVASSLSLSDEQFKLGINNPRKFDNQGNDPAIPQFGDFNMVHPNVFGAGFTPGDGTRPDQLGDIDRFDPGAPPGEVRVDAGARLDVNSGGKIMLFAPKVRNAGHLSAPDGQVILAAGENIYLKSPLGNDPNGVRGLDVAASAVPGWAFNVSHLLSAHGLSQFFADRAFAMGIRDVVLPEMEARAALVGYEVSNTGIVQSDRGNITIQARDINQNGILMASTALNNRNGSVLLRAWGLGTHGHTADIDDLVNWSAGTLTLGANSLVQILPDTTDTSEIEASALATRYRPGWVGMYGELIDIKPQAGVLAPSGTINMETAVNPMFTLWPYYNPGKLGDGSRIYIDSGAFLSVAGLRDMLVPMSRNFIEAELRINELRDSPLLLNSWLRGKKVIVDRREGGVFEDGPMAGVQWVQEVDAGGNLVYMPGEWVGTPLADVVAWIGVGKTDLNELATNAGTITMRAGGSVITRAGSMLDVSGGSVRYTDGINTATKLMGADGRIYTMGQAMPDMDYVGIAGRYTQNHARWGVETTWRNPLIGGDAREAGYTEGRKAGSIQIFAGDAMVLEGEYWGGTVAGDRQQAQPSKNPGGQLQLGNGSKEDKPWWAGQLVIGHDPHLLADGFDAHSVLGEDFFLPPDPDSGSSKPGKLTFMSDDVLNRSGMGSLIFNLAGDFILEPGAILDLAPGTSFTATGGEAATMDLQVDGIIRAPGGSIRLDTFSGAITLGAGSKLDTSGQWINAWRDGSAPPQWAMDGGAITLGAGDLAVDPSAVIDVAGGGRVDIGGKGKPALRVGNGGDVTLRGVAAGEDISALDIRAYAAGSAGRLSIESEASVQIGGEIADPLAVWLPSSLYGERGFGAISVTVRSSGDIIVADGAQVMQLATSIDLHSFAYRDIASGEALADAAPIGVLRPEERLARQAASLDLNSIGGSIRIGSGAIVRTDVGGRLTFFAGVDGSSGAAAGSIEVKGALEAPAGRIALNAPNVTLASGASMLARGASAIHPDSFGRPIGTVLAGGDVSIVGGSTLTLEAGSTIDVSGTYGEVQVPAGSAMRGAAGTQTLGLATDGGSIVLTGGARGSMRIAADLLGHSGGSGAAGGSLTISDVSQGVAGPSAGIKIPTFLYWRDPITNAVTNKIHIQVPDLDLFDEYGTAQVKFTSQILSALTGLPATVGGGMEVVDNMDAPGLSSVVRPWEANALISPMIVDLLTRNFYTSAALTTHIDIPDVKSQSTSRVMASSISNGGFDAVTLDAAKGISLADGVKVSAGRALTLATAKLGNGGTGGSAQLSAPYISIDAITPYVSPVLAAGSALGGQLTLSADLIDLKGRMVSGVGGPVAGTSVSGFATTLLEADDIRLGGALPDQFTANAILEVDLDVAGRLVMKAKQIYPSTAMKAVVRAGDSITIERAGDAAGPALSAGGILRLEAPLIEQNGVLRAPFGQIEFDAGERLVLGAGSMTSVSGDGLVVPYGSLSNNEYWHDPTKPTGTDSSSGSLVAPTEKRITMKAPDVDLAKGAVVDIAGGGDLYAWEFVPGSGGSHDVLAMPGTYAILPGYASPAPASANEAGKRVWLAGGPGLDAGWYTLLPARYALLPGAFAVQATGTAWAGPARPGFAAADGSIVTQGKNGNAYSDAQDASATVWRVMSGKTLRQYTEYNEALANDFFSSESFKLTQYRLAGQNVVTPRLARDGGAVVFDATQRLTLDGTLFSQADTGGRGGLVDIAGKKIAIVGAGQDAASLQADGYLLIDATALSDFGAGSLLVGGTRKGDPLGTGLNVTATDIIVRNDADSGLFGPEIILAATGQLAIEAGSLVRAQGPGASDAGDLIMTPQQAEVYDTLGTPATDDDVLKTPARDWGALIRIANGNAVRVVRKNVDTTVGGLVGVGAGAVIDGGAALLIDATRTTELASSARISGVDLSVAAGRIGFGGGTEGMVLDDAALAQLAGSRHLTLRSYSSFDFYRSVDLGAAGLASLTFDGAAFVGKGAGDIVMRGDTIVLKNSGAGIVASGNDTGGFTLDAGTLVLGAGQKTFGGFGSVTLGGREQIVGEGSGSLDTGSAALTLNTVLLTGRGGATQSIATQDALQVLTVADAAESDDRSLQDSLGSRLSLTGASVLFGGRVVALGGSVDMTATDGDIVVADGAQIDVGGFAKQFFDVAEYADAGRIGLSAVGGDVRLDAGSTLNLAAHRDGGSAGILALTASNGGTVLLDGAISAQAGKGGKAGAFSLDIEALPDFAAFSERLNDAGFNRSRQFRIRQGDVALDGTTTVEDFGLTADQGRVDITGIIDARGTYGGVIRITGGDGVAMQSDAQLLAGATSELGSGRVTLEAVGGPLDIRGGTIDVSGQEGGKVRLRARQNAAHDEIDVAALDVDVIGARSAVLEGIGAYDVADYDGATVDSAKADAIRDAKLFIDASSAIAARLGTDMSIMAGIEICSDGNLTMNGDWNLFTDFAAAREGSLTLRAGGNLIVNGHLSDGFDVADRSGVLQDAASWNLRLVAGSDMDSANVLALKPMAALAAGSGSITVGTGNTSTDASVDNGAGKLVRTGTGDLEVRAGRDLDLAHKESVIYTAGRKDSATWSDFSTAQADAAYGIAGGNLDIAAQGSIEAQPSGQRFVEWLNRQGNLNEQLVFGDFRDGRNGVLPDGTFGKVPRPAEQSSWWIDYSAFQQGVAAFGGGNVSISAGGNLDNLVVALTTTMRMRGGRTADEAKAMETRNGGAMTVDAGGAIRGGQYYLARGEGDIRAGETAVGRTLVVTKNQTTSQTFGVAPVLALGDATLSLRTAGDLRLQSVIDPLLVRNGSGYRDDGQMLDLGAYMSGYTDRTALKLVSAGGDISFVNQAEFVFRDVALLTATTPENNLVGLGGNRYPALTQAVAMNGSVEIQGPMFIMPGTTNDVRLMAQHDVAFNGQNVAAISAFTVGSVLTGVNSPQLVMAYATPEMVPSPFLPVGGSGYDHQIIMDTVLRNSIALNVNMSPSQISRAFYKGIANPGVLALAGDYEPSRIYAAQGSILGAEIVANEQTWLKAGTDVRGLRIDGRNVHASDVTLVEAGNDIIAVKPVRNGLNATFYGTGSITMQGAGALMLSAGRDVYGNDLRIQTLGNQQYDANNRPIADTQVKGLPAEGAAITVMAGMNQAAGYAAFASAYLDPASVAAMPDYLKVKADDGSVLPLYLVDTIEARPDGQQKMVRRGLVSYMQDMTGETLAPLDAWTRFQALPQLAQQQFLRQIYLLELRDAGRDQNEPGIGGLPRNGGYNRGYAAIDALFPGDGWKGSVAANNMMLRTMAGGDISVLTPGGGLQVAALGATVPPGHGLVTLASGHIDVFAHDDVVVNRSRLLSFVPAVSARGSDQIIWSTVGDIDAGRGAKTVRVPSAPEVVTGVDGHTEIREKSDMSGSGIGTVGDGDVDLVAPEGTVNAGDAGIRVAGNLNIAALQVLNADNIQVKGEIKGLPQVAAVNIGALTNASAAASQATAAAQDVVQRERAAARQALPSVFTVRVIGFGSETMEGGQAAPSSPAPSGLQSKVERRYDPANLVQVVGLGRNFDPKLLARMTDSERRQLKQDR